MHICICICICICVYMYICIYVYTVTLLLHDCLDLGQRCKAGGWGSIILIRCRGWEDIVLFVGY